MSRRFFGLDLDYLDSTWTRLGLFGFGLDYLDSTILWLGLDLGYLDSPWIIWIRRFLPWSRLGLFEFDLDDLESPYCKSPPFGTFSTPARGL